MKLFIWNNVDPITSNWHSGGGIAVIAETLERAREIINEKTHDLEHAPCSALTDEPDLVRECEGPEIIMLFQDAGCC